MGLEIGNRVTVRPLDRIATYVHGASGRITDIRSDRAYKPQTLYLVEFDEPLSNPVSVLSHMHFLRDDLE